MNKGKTTKAGPSQSTGLYKADSIKVRLTEVVSEDMFSNNSIHL